MSHTITISKETHQLLQEVKKIFVSYTGESIENFTDDKVIEILVSWFVDTTDTNEEHSHECACGWNGKCKHNNEHEGCGCGHTHHH